MKTIRSILKRKSVKVIAILLLLIFIGVVYIYRNINKDTRVGEEETTSEEDLSADLNGDREKERVVLEMPDDESINYLKSIKVYDKSGSEIASLPSEVTIKIPMTDSLKIYKLNENDPKEYFSLDFIAGPHQSETMFFEMRERLILPVCHKEDVEGPYDCLFYSGNTGYLPIKDLDGDGLVELIETVDEYPSIGELSAEEKDAINQTFDEQEVDEFTEGAEIIAKREKGGRGRMVVWSIFSYNGKRFIEQTGFDYEKYYLLIGNFIDNKMKKPELSKDSLDYIEFTRNFWAHKL